MDGFRAAAAVACFIGIVIALVDTLAPSEKFSKQLKVMYAVIFMLTVITPIANGSISFDGEAIDAYADKDYYAASQLAGENYLKTAIERNISRNIDELLKAENISVQKIETSINISEDGSIDITVIDLMLDPALAEKAAGVIRQSVQDELVINIYEEVKV